MRNAVVGSSLLHLALLVTLFAVRLAPTIIVPGPDVVQVALVDPTPGATIAPPPPQPKQPAPETQTLQPTEDAGIKVAPPKPVKPKPETRKPEPAAPETPAAALPYQAVGTSGLRGQISLDTNFEFTYYLLLVRNRVAQSWSPPAGLTNGGKPVQATVYFRITRSGALGEARVETSSGFEFFDRSALRAVQLGDPMPPLPLGYGGGDLGVHFDFQYVAP